jgi:hypothetical protein
MDPLTLISIIDAGAAALSASTSVAAVGQTAGANAQRSCTLTLTNKTLYLLRPSSIPPNDLHGGSYIGFSSLDPFTSGTVRFESGGVLTGADSVLNFDFLSAPAYTQAQASDMSDQGDEGKLKKLLLERMAASGKDIVYFPTKATLVAKLQIRVAIPWNGTNRYYVGWRPAEDKGGVPDTDSEGPTGDKEAHCDSTNCVVHWSASAGNRATMSLEIDD